MRFGHSKLDTCLQQILKVAIYQYTISYKAMLVYVLFTSREMMHSI